MFFKKLYVRIWLAVVIAMAVLTFLVGWAWRMAAEPPLRVVVISDEAGQVIGSGYSRRVRPSPGGLSSIWPGSPFARLNHLPGQSSDVDVDGDDVAPATEGRTGRGPEFVAHMNDGRILQLHLPRPPPSFWSRPPFGFLWTLGLVGVAVALATYPIIRKLTRRLERLRQDVEQWGEGDLSVRMPVSGQDEVAFLAGRFNHAAERIENLVALQKALLASQKSLLASCVHPLRVSAWGWN
jgi:HAMP domain-containing protein